MKHTPPHRCRTRVTCIVWQTCELAFFFLIYKTEVTEIKVAHNPFGCFHAP